MALSNTATASYSNILHPNKDTQTDPSRATYYSFVDKLLQPMAQQQKSYLKDTTHLINFLEKTKVPENTILVSMDVMSLCTNIPQEELRINIKKRTSYPYTTTAKSAQTYPSLILAENFFQFTGKTGLARAPKWQLLSPIFSWLR